MRTVLPRFGAIVIGCLLASATITFAAGNGSQPAAPAPPAAAVTQPAALVVPDVRNQAYVFAKGTLEDAGFAWKVTGSVEGYAANVVVTQSPAAGTRVVDTGAPLVTLGLERNPGYVQEGEPENASPYAGTALELAGVPSQAPPPAVKAPQPKPAAKPKAPKEKPRAQPKEKPKAKAKPATKPIAKRPPAFEVTGAPAEPLDEIPLTERASRLGRYVDAHRKPTDAAVRHWLYQHEWIVAGARFGWWRSAEALEILVAVDRKVERRWGIGTRSRRLAERALAEVRARS